MKIEYVTNVPGLSEIDDIAPIKYLDVMPDWFKHMPNMAMDNMTARKCPAFTDLFRYSYVMRMWCDLHISFEEDREIWQWSVPHHIYQVEEHPPFQFTDHFGGGYLRTLKPISPWWLKVPKGYSVLQMPLTYSPSPIFDTVPGILHSDLYHGTNPQLLIKDIKPGEAWSATIPRGTPLVAHIPFKRDEWELDVSEDDGRLAQKSHLVSFGKFKNSYRQLTKGWLK